MSDDLKRYAGGCIIRMIKDGKSPDEIDPDEINKILKGKFSKTIADHEIAEIVADIASRSESSHKPKQVSGGGSKVSPIEKLAKYLKDKGYDAVIVYSSGKANFWVKPNKD